jgi:hypothetical protein
MESDELRLFHLLHTRGTRHRSPNSSKENIDRRIWIVNTDITMLLTSFGINVGDSSLSITIQSSSISKDKVLSEKSNFLSHDVTVNFFNVFVANKESHKILVL